MADPEPRDDAHTDPQGRPPEDRDRQHDSEEWVQERYPLVDADFVDDTLDRVLDDQTEIAAEARRVEDFEFPAGFLATASVPEHSPGFVADTLSRVLAERAEGRWQDGEQEAVFHDMVQAYDVPEPRPDFVEHTYQALVAERRRGQMTRVAESAPGRRRFALAASLAAIVLCGVTIFWPDSGDGGATDRALQATPVAWASLLPESDTEDGIELRLEIGDPISAFVGLVNQELR
jgi:hypothetical protein